MLTGLVVTATVAISAASIAHGAVSYLGILLPWPPVVLLLALIVACAAVAAYGVGESVVFAATIGILEIGGLVAATTAGMLAAPEWHLSHDAAGRSRRMEPHRLPEPSSPSSPSPASKPWLTWPRRRRSLTAPCRSASLPRSWRASCSYVSVATAAVLSDSGSDRPLLDIFRRSGAYWPYRDRRLSCRWQWHAGADRDAGPAVAIGMARKTHNCPRRSPA